MKSAGSAPLARWSSDGASGNTESGVPAAAQTSWNASRAGSTYPGKETGWPKGGVPPTANPVAARASSGEALRTSDAPATPASFEGSTRFAPDVNAITGRSSAMKISDFTICATSQPIAFAAAAAVFVPSGNRWILGSTPSRRADSVKRAIAPIKTTDPEQADRPRERAWPVLYDSAP